VIGYAPSADARCHVFRPPWQSKGQEFLIMMWCVCVCVVNCDLRVRSEAEVLVLYDEGVQKLYSFLPVDIICGLSALKIIKK
jgi:hypothetical protein